MAVKIKLMRLGKIRAPYYRIVVADSRTKRDGRSIETIGKYHPTEEPSLIEVDSERVQYWLGVGAQPTEPVQAILRVTGDWQKFKGEPGAEGTLKAQKPKVDKRAVFEAAAKEAGGESESAEATTTRKRAAKKAPVPAETPAPTETPAPAGDATPPPAAADASAETTAEAVAEVEQAHEIEAAGTAEPGPRAADVETREG